VPSRPVFVITGPSGAGKGTLIKGLLERVPGLEIAVSATTRAQRPGEIDGHDYWFLSDEEFTRRVDAGEFLEYVPYVSGRRYGTLRSELERISGDDKVCVLELELEERCSSGRRPRQRHDLHRSGRNRARAALRRVHRHRRSASGSSCPQTLSRPIASATWFETTTSSGLRARSLQS
jgi:hypothetical protein